MKYSNHFGQSVNCRKHPYILRDRKSGKVYCRVCRELLGVIDGKAWRDEDYLMIMEKLQRQVFCRACGCTNKRACSGGCSWVAPGKCSSCFDAIGNPIKKQNVREQEELEELYAY